VKHNKKIRIINIFLKMRIFIDKIGKYKTIKKSFWEKYWFLIFPWFSSYTQPVNITQTRYYDIFYNILECSDSIMCVCVLCIRKIKEWNRKRGNSFYWGISQDFSLCRGTMCIGLLKINFKVHTFINHWRRQFKCIRSHVLRSMFENNILNYFFEFSV